MMKKQDYSKFIIFAELVICAAVIILYCFRDEERVAADSDDMLIEDFRDAGETPAESGDIASFIEKYASQREFSTESNDGMLSDSTQETEEEHGNEPSESQSNPQEPKPDNHFWEREAAKNDWRLILVNKQHYIPEDYSMNLVSVNGGMQVDERIAEPLANLLAGAREDGISLMIVSAYRSESHQTRLFQNKIKKYLRQGMSYMDAYAKASFSVTVPGSSEHQIGLALDIVTAGHTSLNEEFGKTPAGIWLKEHGPEYGFILRYPKGKEQITGITYEPWHFRYVGDYAQAITDSGLTLEEYLEGLQ